MEEINKDYLFKRVELKPGDSEKLDIQPYSFWKTVFKSLLKKPSVIVAFFIMILLLFFTVFGPMIHSIHIYGIQGEKNLLPNSVNWFGTNQHYEDIWTKTWLGARTSLSLAFIISLINISIGLVVGAIWGYFRKIDLFMLEFKNLIYNIPNLLVIIVLIAVLGRRGFWPIVLCLTIFGWFGLASFVRNHIIIYTNREYNIASRTLGSSPFHMIIHNILPYILSVVVTQVATMIPAYIGVDVMLAYLGIGFTSNVASLGTVLEVGYTSDIIAHPHILLIPSLVVALFALSFFLVGLGLADATDPRKHK